MPKETNPYVLATPLDQILCALQIWRNMDHADKIEMSRNDVITIIEGVKAIRRPMPTCQECGTVATPASIQTHTKECSRGRPKPMVIDDD